MNIYIYKLMPFELLVSFFREGAKGCNYPAWRVGRFSPNSTFVFASTLSTTAVAVNLWLFS